MSTPTVVARSTHHHGSHSSLLSALTAADSVPAEVEAIIVPTSRPTANLAKAIALAARLDCTLVALCSKLADVDDAVTGAKAAGVKILAVDTEKLPPGLMPEFATSVKLRSTVYDRQTDLSAKRNLGLLLADVIGWERVVFLDDDITVERPDDLRDAAGLLRLNHGAVGLANDGYHDNSVVCHAYRDAGGRQQSFIGGGALAVGVESYRSFFPNIYSEDWFFLIGDNDSLRRTAVTGKAFQSPYDPFSDIRRARAEEFGDSLAEGVFALLDAKARLQDATFKYWRGFLDNRRRFIDDVRGMVLDSDLDPEVKTRRIAALKAARNRSTLITPKLCVDYLRWWRGDRDRWALHLEDIRQTYGFGLEPEKAVARLGLMHCARVAL
jgi:glycosyltransferase involved in cell wall biosynthesis